MKIELVKSSSTDGRAERLGARWTSSSSTAQCVKLRNAVAMADRKTTVLLTGATGRVGGILRAHWGSNYQLRLADVRPLGAETILASGEPETREMNRAPLQDHEEFVYCDCADYEQMLAACSGADVVVHLAADPNPNSSWEESLLPRNVIGCYNAFNAAHEAGCSRIVFASSVNAVNGYETEGWHGAAGVGVDMPVWPVNVYGAAKCFGEVRWHSI